MKNNVEFSQIETVAKSEKLLKEWVFSETTEVENKPTSNISKVQVTDKRLIISEREGNESFRKYSYKINDIKAVNYSISQSISKTILSIALMFFGILFLIASFNLFITNSSFSNTITEGIITLVLGIAMLLIGIKLYKNKKVNSKIRLVIETCKTEQVKLLEASTQSSKNILTNKNINNEIELTITPEVVDMCITLDKLITDIQNGVCENLYIETAQTKAEESPAPEVEKKTENKKSEVEKVEVSNEESASTENTEDSKSETDNIKETNKVKKSTTKKKTGTTKRQNNTTKTEK